MTDNNVPGDKPTLVSPVEFFSNPYARDYPELNNVNFPPLMIVQNMNGFYIPPMMAVDSLSRIYCIIVLT